MKLRAALVTLVIIIIDCKVASAMTTSGYGLLRESLVLVFALACLILSGSIFASLKGGSLGIPWILFIAAFSVAALGGIIEILDSVGLVFSNYDLRPAVTITHSGSMLLLMIGLICHKRGLR
jgi:hypothetical protein